MKNRFIRFVTVCTLMNIALLMTGCGSGEQTSNSLSDNRTPAGTMINFSEVKSYDEGTAAPGTKFSYNLTGSVCWNSSCDNLIYASSVTVSQPTTTESNTYNVTQVDVSITNTTSNLITTGTATNYISQSGYLYKVIYDDGAIGTATWQQLLPATAAVGNSGNYISLSYSDGSTEIGTWRIEPGYNGDGLIIFTFVKKDYSNNVMWTQEIGHTIKPDGTIYDKSITTNYPDGTVVKLQGTRL
jgi:hypothetical protein